MIESRFIFTKKLFKYMPKNSKAAVVLIVGTAITTAVIFGGVVATNVIPNNPKIIKEGE